MRWLFVVASLTYLAVTEWVPRYMQWSFLTTKAVVGQIAGYGRGCIATEPIATGETTAAFGGWAATGQQLAAARNSFMSLALQIDDDLYLVSPNQSDGDCINHSCDPNCGLQGGVVLVAMRDIAAGEQVTFDYSMADGSPYDEFDCACGSLRCRGRVSGDDWMLPDLQDRYRGYFSPYLTRRISALITTQTRNSLYGPSH
jgi:uncharacterized protein